MKKKKQLDSIISENDNGKNDQSVANEATTARGQTTSREQTTVRDHLANKEKEANYLDIQKVDEVLSSEVKGYAIAGGKTFKTYWQEFNEGVRTEVTRIISNEKFLLQASYLSIYFEMRFITFHSGTGQFVNENFAKLIEDFCHNADKEYKMVPSAFEHQGSHPLYFCYVAENNQDFYLVEYVPDATNLRVYTTAAPMLSVLHKHLSKIDIKRISKKSFYVTRLNFYDSEVGVELRNLLLDPKAKTADDSDEEDDSSLVSKPFKYFVFITVFLLQNTPNNQNPAEITFTIQNLITFYNYLADFQTVSLKNQESNEPIPSTFEFCYPFVDIRQERDLYLLYNKDDLSMNVSMTAVRNQSYRDKNFPRYTELLSEENLQNPNLLDNDLLDYLKHNENKLSFNFDGNTYLTDYLKRLSTSQGEANQGPAGNVRVFTKEHSQNLLELFNNGVKNTDDTKGLEDILFAPKVYLLFEGNVESYGLLMISYDRKKERCTVFYWDDQDIVVKAKLEAFVNYIAKLLRNDHKASSAEAQDSLHFRHVTCVSKTKGVLSYFENHYFPFTYLFDAEHKSRKRLEIGYEELVGPMKLFLSVNIAENNLDVFKAYARIIEDKMFKDWEIANIGTLWKFLELKQNFQILGEKLYEEKVENILMSFNFMGAKGSKIYFCYLKEIQDQEEESKESKEEKKTNPSSQETTYSVTLYSLTYESIRDDQEVLTILYQACSASSKVKFVFNAAYHVNPQNNILLYTQTEITLTTLGYLVHYGKFSMEQAFKKIANSVVAHYEILETIMSQTDALTSNDNEAVVANTDSHSPNKLFADLGVKFKVYQSYFEDILKELHFKRKLNAEIPKLLSAITVDSKENKEAMDIASFLNQMNCEFASPPTYFFATNEGFTKRVINNESHILTDKNMYALLIKELLSSRQKYEEALELRYQQTIIYFIIPYNLVKVHDSPLVKYNVESHQVTFYHLSSDQKAHVNENILAFIETLSVKLASGNSQALKAVTRKELKITLSEVALSDDIQELLETQYPVFIKCLIHLSSRRYIAREAKLSIDIEKLNAFMCQYSDDVLKQTISDSKVKVHYKYLSNLFLQKDSPLTKKTALLTFINGTATIEQLNIIKDCVRSFRKDFDRIQGIQHAFFCFNVQVKNNFKHYLMHLIGENRDNLCLKVFTNGLGDSDTVIDRMIQSYCIDEGENEQGGSKIGELLFFKINIQNTAFTRYLDLSSLLIAHAVCNDLLDSNEYCAQLALSPVHYHRELVRLEKKCEDFNLFKDIPAEKSA